MEIRQSLRLQPIMTRFRKRWSGATDVRKPGNHLKYTVADGILAAFAVFFMQSGSFLEHQRLLQSKKGRNNARSLAQVEEIPSDPQIRNLVDPLSSAYFQEDYWYLLDQLKEGQSLLGDDLYANQPLCQLIDETYHQFFLFVCKLESHSGLYEWLAFLEKNNGIEKVSHRHWNGKQGEIWSYRFANQVP